MRKIVLLAALGVGGCSSAPPPPPPPPPPPAPDIVPVAVVAQPAGLQLAALDGHEWQALGENGWRRTYRFDGDRYRASGFPAWEESGRVELVSSDEHRMRLRFVDRIFDGQPDDPLEVEVELAEDGRSFDMNGESYQALPQAAVVAVDATE